MCCQGLKAQLVYLPSEASDHWQTEAETPWQTAHTTTPWYYWEKRKVSGGENIQRKQNHTDNILLSDLPFTLQICPLVGTFFLQTRYKPVVTFLVTPTFQLLLVATPWHAGNIASKWVSWSLPNWSFVSLCGCSIQHMLIHPCLFCKGQLCFQVIAYSKYSEGVMRVQAARK